jgi:hypothetical protein
MTSFEGVRIQAGALSAAGLNALRSAGPPGQAPRLSDAQLAAIDQALR